jgi:hypothetical protein
MAWVRIHDGATRHHKILNLSDKAFRMWVEGLSHAQEGLTDGLLPHRVLRTFGVRVTANATKELVDGGLWHRKADGYEIHHFLDWNDSKDAIRHREQLAKHRGMFIRNPDLRRTLRQRDQDRCRYCGVEVNWSDRRGGTGATYDHVDPRGPADLTNLVVACRSCNSSKGGRAPDEAGMTLRPEPRSRSDLEKTQTPTIGLVLSDPFVEKDRVGESAMTDVGRFLQWYRAEAYPTYRNGATYTNSEHLDYAAAKQLCATFSREDLHQIAITFLQIPDEREPWLRGKTRTVPMLRSKATSIHERLLKRQQA